MVTKKIKIAILVSLLITSTAYPVLAASGQSAENNRYFIQSTRTFWKGTLGARNHFEDGFTADLSDWQLRLAKLAGLKVYTVKKLNILAEEALPSADPSPSASPELTPESDKSKDVKDSSDVSGRKPTPGPSTRPLPSAQLPWGVKMLYNDPLLTRTSGGADILVAVLDTGINSNHPDLKNRLAGCRDFSQNKSPMIEGKCDDGNGHGTHVSGIIAADGGTDGFGIYGMAPEATLLAYKVCTNNGTCWSDDIAMGIRNAADMGANIINMSLGSDVKSSLIVDAVDYAVSKGVLVVAAAGNDGPYQESIDYPGALANVVAVGAVDGGRNVPDWSSRGANALTTADIIEEGDIEFAAPGVNVESTWKDGSYVILSGTSMAAPHLTGLAAKLWDSLASDSAETIRAELKTISTDVFPEGEDDASGYGIPSY